ncbi:hypothetical protein [Agrobacterium tumefaciens]|uniref:hypothetical protein n=1 Tax=Agrobacterium tumefaciens TaxID=358 RepID=UPI001572FF0E|nr:hypothetical protein [Agrobacterium tumefaciens]NTB05865.1 hypothetical protein [Agrobacterium tumefaciens]
MKIIAVILFLMVLSFITIYRVTPAAEDVFQLKYLIALPVAALVILGWHLLNRK